MSGLRNRAGFTMLEVMMAILVIGILVPMVMWVGASTWGKTGKANQLRLATEMIDNKVDELKLDLVKSDGVQPAVADWTCADPQRGVKLCHKVEVAYRDEGAGTPVVVVNTRKVLLIAVVVASDDTIMNVTTFVAKDY